ncbi:MAG: hypoxanthine phosphoribosyltransferase [Hyphomonas sp.]|jgi:hypoxanthine phosphoribosyltransferase|nr:hypoxanthine phosphoribosyltransferase [Hyphomonas sp.]
MPKIDVILSEADLMARVDDLADRLVPRLTGDWTAVSILIGATPFTSDLMKALARRGVHPVLDVLWLESYRDARESSGRVVVRADVSRPVEGRGMLLIDDVFDTGRTLDFAKQHLIAKGAREVLTVALTQKPWAPRGPEGVDFCAFDAPGRFLVGYGMDDAGLYRGLPYIGALD